MEDQLSKHKIESIINRTLTDGEYREIIDFILNKLLQEKQHE